MELDSLKNIWQKNDSAGKIEDEFVLPDIGNAIHSESIGALSIFRKKIKTAGFVLSISAFILFVGIIVFISEHLLLYFGIPALIGLGLFIYLLTTNLVKLDIKEDTSIKVALDDKIKFLETYYKYAKVIGSITTPFFLITAGILSLNLGEKTNTGNLPILIIMVWAVMISVYMIFLADKDKHLEQLRLLKKEFDEISDEDSIVL